MTIKALFGKVIRLDTDTVVEQSMDETADKIAEKNRQQLFEGEDNIGEHLAPYKNKRYAFKKNAMNQRPGLGNPDLKLTGAFHRGIYVRVNGDRIEEGSADEKAGDLEKKYGSEIIYGLNSTFKASYLVEDLGPVIRQKITNLIGLKFK